MQALRGSFAGRVIAAVVALALTLLATMSVAAARADDNPDPGLAALVHNTVPEGMKSDPTNPFSKGRLEAADLNELQGSDVPELPEGGVIYSAGWAGDQSIAMVITFSTRSSADGPSFVTGFEKSLPKDRVAFDTGIPKTRGNDFTSNGVDFTSITFDRDGRGFGILTAGMSREEVTTFAEDIVSGAEQLGTRDDQTDTSSVAYQLGRLLPVVVIIGAIVGLVIWRSRNNKKKAMATTSWPPPAAGSWPPNASWPPAAPMPPVEPTTSWPAPAPTAAPNPPTPPTSPAAPTLPPPPPRPPSNDNPGEFF